MYICNVGASETRISAIVLWSSCAAVAPYSFYYVNRFLQYRLSRNGLRIHKPGHFRKAVSQLPLVIDPPAIELMLISHTVVSYHCKMIVRE